MVTGPLEVSICLLEMTKILQRINMYQYHTVNLISTVDENLHDSGYKVTIWCFKIDRWISFHFNLFYGMFRITSKARHYKIAHLQPAITRALTNNAKKMYIPVALILHQMIYTVRYHTRVCQVRPYLNDFDINLQDLHIKWAGPFLVDSVNLSIQTMKLSPRWHRKPFMRAVLIMHFQAGLNDIKSRCFKVYLFLRVRSKN